VALEGGAGSAARPDTASPVLGGGSGSSLRPDKHLPEIAALLDGRQFDLISAPDSGLAVIRGGAGSGKTTVALHRLAFLHFQAPARYRPKRMLVVVFNRALARYIERVLPALGVHGVVVSTLEDWAAALCRRHFRSLLRERSEATPAAAVRFKTHRILIPMLQEAARAAPKADPLTLFDELFTDRGWLQGGVRRHAPASFTPGEIDAVHRWCTDQQYWRTDGGGPGEDDRPAYDEADDMILLRLQQLLRGPLLHSPGHKLGYDHLVVDEAQDFSPLELLVLLQTAKQNSVSLAGDTAQRITENDFSDWDEVLSWLGQKPVQVTPLQISYRCTRQIMELANALLGEERPSDPGQAARTGAAVELLRCSDRGAAMTFLGDALADLVRREPKASVAVLTRTTEQADQAYQALRRADIPPLRRVLDQDFSFGPAVEVTDIAQTKGLEFDYVVLLDLDRATFPDTSSSRHLLHVGATRAVHQLWLVCWDRPSPVLPDWLPQRLAG
jgi:DNA helicase-2/ATP-dependent DNA helicase PcrA